MGGEKRADLQESRQDKGRRLREGKEGESGGRGGEGGMFRELKGLVP